MKNLQVWKKLALLSATVLLACGLVLADLGIRGEHPILFALLCSGAVVALALYIIRDITRPLGRLVGAARDLAAGRLDVQTDFEQRGDEIGELAFAFRRMIEAERANRQHDVDNRIALLAANERLANTMHEAQAANHAKRDFLAVISHEIRTPMNGVIGMTELTLNTELGELQREYLTIARNSADALLGLIDDILDFSKIESGKLELEIAPFDLRETLHAPLQTLTARAAEKGLALVLHVAPEVPGWLSGDAHRLRQIALNLLGNAVKFTERGEVALRVEVVEQSAADVLLRIAVSDTGLGIDPAAQEKIFTAFEQADQSTTRRFGGTGLGLAITKLLVELMGAKLEVASELGKGSTFSFVARFPLATPPTARAESADEPATQRPLRILLAEDNAVNQRVATANLEAWGHRVTIVSDGAAVLAAHARESFDVILMDAQMPIASGLEVTRQIRERESAGGARVPIVAMTANVRHGFREECFAAGMDAFVAKPIRRKDLLAALHSAVPSGFLPSAPDAAEVPQTNRDLLQEMIALCLESDAPRLLGELRAGVEQRDFAAVEQAAHALKGMVGEFKCSACEAAARTLETAAREQQPAAFTNLAKDFETAFADFTSTLRSDPARLN